MGIWAKIHEKNPNFVHIFCTDLPQIRKYFSTKIMPQLAGYREKKYSPEETVTDKLCFFI